MDEYKYEENDMKDAVTKALDALVDQIQAIPEAERAEFVQMCACLTIALIRGMEGKEFCKGFLTDALNDSSAPSITLTQPGKH